MLDKISGAVLIGTRQKQARIQFLAAIVEQLLVDNKRARDTEAARHEHAAAAAPHAARGVAASLLDGAGNDLRTWRQP